MSFNKQTSSRIAFCAFLLLAVGVAAAGRVQAGVTRIEILERKPYAEGREFEGVGAYQRLLGRVHFAVDPEAAANRRSSI